MASSGPRSHSDQQQQKHISANVDMRNRSAKDVIELSIEPSSEAQSYFLKSTKRNILFNSGYGAGKTYIACFKLLLLLIKFPKSRAVIGRQKYTDLAKTTRETFFQICPPALYNEGNGGARSDSRGYLKLINGSEIFFMHFDNLDLRSIKSLEINFLLLDQAEEIAEAIYLALDARLGRKSDAIVPPELIAEFEKPDEDGTIRSWPRNPLTKRPLVPVYSFLLMNPPDEGWMHYLVMRFHPKSDLWREKYRHVNDYVYASSRDNKALSPENLENMLTRDEEWVKRYVDAEIGYGEGTIHHITEDSIIEVPAEFVDNLKKKAILTRCLDHGASSPTCCLWFATLKGFYYCYQEYYLGDSLISEHRRNINDLTGDDYISFNLADPSIFKKTTEKLGGFWTVADEYLTGDLDSPSLIWAPADNNEFATRNRINELLRIDPNLINPVTGQRGSPKLFFIKRNEANPHGCYHVIRETSAQKKVLLDTINGKNIYSDERNEKIVDHAYDPLRYFAAQHLKGKKEPMRRHSANSFLGAKQRLKALRLSGQLDSLGIIN